MESVVLADSESTGNVLIDDKLFSKLSPLQQKILSALAAKPMTLNELSERTGSSVHTVGKQLSLLQLRTKYNSLDRKGISKPLVRKNKDIGVRTTYFLISMMAALE